MERGTGRAGGARRDARSDEAARTGRRGAGHRARTPRSRWGRLAAAVVALVASLALVGVGALCVAIPETIVEVLPYLLGSVMVFTGVASVVSVARDASLDPAGDVPEPAEDAPDPADAAPTTRVKLVREGHRSVGASFVLVVLGVFAIACGEQSIGFLGTAWGLVSLYKVGNEFDEALDLVRAKRHVAVVPTLLGLFELVLALLLILNPFANIEHHVIVLGIELVLYPFKLHRERGERGAEVEV